jgi:CxxC-x17-CxxC domain-containing protein
VRTETRTHCSACGEETTVPFRPTQGRPVLCRSCFQKAQTGQQMQQAPPVQP